MIIHILNYNNYYNRITKPSFGAKKVSTYTKYLTVEPQKGYNFFTSDGVDATVIVNIDHDVSGDYVLIADDYYTATVKSHWYIIETESIRQGQVKLHLHRDLIIDYFDDIKDAPAFIEKSSFIPLGDIATFNKENINFNQIKTREVLLNDNTNCAWIVGYVARDYPKNSNGEVSNKTISWSLPSTKPADISVSNISDWIFYKYCNLNDSPSKLTILNRDNTLYNTHITSAGWVTNPLGERIYGDVGVTYSVPATSQYGTYISSITKGLGFVPALSFSPKNDLSSSQLSEIGDNLFKRTYNFGTNAFKALTTSLGASNYISGNEMTINDVLKLNGQILRTTSGGITHTYVISAAIDDSVDKNLTGLSIQGSDFQTIMYNHVNFNKKNYTTGSGTSSVELSYTPPSIAGNENTAFGYTTVKYTVNLNLTEIFDSYTIDFPGVDRYHLNDAPYDMFCMQFPVNRPVGFIEGTTIAQENRHKSLSSINLRAAQEIFKALTANGCYDIQIVPYCPLDESYRRGSVIIPGDSSYTDIIQAGTNKVTLIKDNNNKNAGIIFWATNASGSKNIKITKIVNNKEQYVYKASDMKTSLDKKIDNETKLYRLCSPNYNGLFDFSPSMNGDFDYVNVDYTYKPYSPYIHVAPIFNGLYGSDFNDARGLICNGDFSISLITDEWKKYEAENKNYNNIFNREIQNLETTHKLDMTRSGINSLLSIGGGAIGGALAGAKAGPVGMVGGAITGSLSATIGSVSNMSIKQSLHNETLDYKNDMYNYNLQNIQALPNSISKVSSITANNKYFPFVEIYECSETEKEAFKNKIKYNGATIGRIGTISEFLTKGETYIKCKLIRPEINNIDFHQVNALADELNMGSFITA